MRRISLSLALLFLVGPAMAAQLAYVLVFAPSVVAAQTVSLVEAPAVGSCFQVHLEMTLNGELHLQKDGKPVPLQARAVHDFSERVVLNNAQGFPQKVVRNYETAESTIVRHTERVDATLRPERHLLVVQKPREQVVVFSPAGPLTREELQLTSEHLDTLSLPGLLPSKAVSTGESWKIAPTVLQALCAFEAISASDVTARLETIENDVARIVLEGSATGIDVGAQAKVRIQGVLQFNVKVGQIVGLEWNQKDEREEGPVNPASKVETRYVLTRKAIEQPAVLSDVALVRVPDGLEPPPMYLMLCHREPKGRYQVNYAREWHITGQTAEYLVLRLMERGDWIAQATITPWTPAEPGKHISPEQFTQEMTQTPGWEADQEIQSGEVPLEGGLWGYRLSQVGRLEGQRVTQNFYVIAGPTGEQVVLTFTMSPSQVERLGTRDLSLVASMELPKVSK